MYQEIRVQVKEKIRLRELELEEWRQGHKRNKEMREYRRIQEATE